MNKKAQVGRVFVAWIVVALMGAFFLTFFWETLNQRLFIPIARWLRFKKDDTERVEKKVEEILGENVKTKNKAK
jgi:hypothetical protein